MTTPVLTGVIAKVARTRPGFGVVELTTPHQGRKYGVINDETRGRIDLINRSGQLRVNTRVIIEDFELGAEGLRITKIKERIG
ncbi:MAG TPA: hypothetical protein VIY48_13005 [Candidatus Paceibacterota bacterium]